MIDKNIRNDNSLLSYF